MVTLFLLYTFVHSVEFSYRLCQRCLGDAFYLKVCVLRCRWQAVMIAPIFSSPPLFFVSRNLNSLDSIRTSKLSVTSKGAVPICYRFHETLLLSLFYTTSRGVKRRRRRRGLCSTSIITKKIPRYNLSLFSRLCERG